MFSQNIGNCILSGIRVLDPENSRDEICNVTLKSGMIQSICSATEAQQTKPELPVVDCEGLWFTPGWVDIHTHFREPGQEWKEDIESGSRAAARGGVVCAVAMANTVPRIDSAATLSAVLQRGREVGLIDYQNVGACSVDLAQKELAPLVQLAAAGAAAFSDDGYVIQNGQFMRRVMEYAATLNKAVVVHAEDLHIRQDGVMHEGEISWKLGLRGNPSAAEATMIARDIELAALTGCHVHIQHVTSKEAVEVIRAGKKRGINVTAEVCTHHLALTDEAIETLGTAAKMAPPLRSEADRQALIQGLKEGVFDCIATDHAPHAPHEKELPFDDAPFGILGFQTYVPIALTIAAEAGMSPLEIVNLATLAAAKTMDLAHGTLPVGAKGPKAEFTIIDPEASWVLDQDNNESKSINSPWWGQTLRGKVLATAYQGKFSYLDDAWAKISQ